MYVPKCTLSCAWFLVSTENYHVVAIACYITLKTFAIFLYWNILKTQHLIQCQFLPEDQIVPVSDNAMDKSDQLACIRYKNQNVLAVGYRDVAKIVQKPKI